MNNLRVRVFILYLHEKILILQVKVKTKRVLLNVNYLLGKNLETSEKSFPNERPNVEILIPGYGLLI